MVKLKCVDVTIGIKSIDDYNREVLGIDVATSTPSLRVIRYLDQLAEWHGYPDKIRVDNGLPFKSTIF